MTPRSCSATPQGGEDCSSSFPKDRFAHSCPHNRSEGICRLLAGSAVHQEGTGAARLSFNCPTEAQMCHVPARTGHLEVTCDPAEDQIFFILHRGRELLPHSPRGSHPKGNQPQLGSQTSPLSQIWDRTGPELLFTAQSHCSCSGTEGEDWAALTEKLQLFCLSSCSSHAPPDLLHSQRFTCPRKRCSRQDQLCSSLALQEMHGELAPVLP
ncbi:PREDICTED: uncharacterized protein LOC108449462 [Corvus brachyrhynchos]|uniref:uncharacterized protein LOC108449462 n=1 Tax=Corvus brachyrhynchos TaxID=85066 RepID=UPI00081642D1|nr:PREDICTED: uncharacterized protein LOC108449462 [Corvus brachyrhynchos]